MRLKGDYFAAELVGDGKTRFCVAIDSVSKKLSLLSFRRGTNRNSKVEIEFL